MSIRLHLVATAALLALALAARPASAQLRTASSIDLRGRRLAVAPESYVRVSVGGVRMQGRTLEVDGDSLLRLASDAGPVVEVPTSGVDTLWTRHHHTGRGAGIGAAVGGLGLGTLGLLFASAMCETGACGGETMGFGLISGLAGAAGGALLGAAAGSLVTTWRRVAP